MAGLPEEQIRAPRRERSFSQEPLLPEENERVRRLLESDDRAHWFWSTIRTWIMWMGGVSIALVALKDTLSNLIRGLGGK